MVLPWLSFAESITGIEALDRGPLRVSSMVEALTPLLITIGTRNKRRDTGVRFFSLPGGEKNHRIKK
jgi:predicted dinucleotide-binding enzyme